jgi:hypothetical protein
VSTSEDEIRKVDKTGAGLEQQVDDMENRSAELGSEIQSVRDDFKRKRNDSDVVGLPPEPEVAREKTADPDEETHSAGPGAPPKEASPTESESGAASIVEDSVPLPGNPGDEGVHGEDPDSEDPDSEDPHSE